MLIYMTRKTYKILQERLRYLTTEKAIEMKKTLKAAKSGGGGMHDNAGYENALMQEKMLAQQIVELVEKLQNPIFIDDLPINTNKVNIGTLVKIRIISSKNKKEVKEYAILGPDESNPKKNIISYLSPIGKSLIGRSINEEVEILIGGKHLQFKVLEIKKLSYKGGDED